MALNKEAYIRYKIIDSLISDKKKPYPSLYDIIDACTNSLGKEFHPSTILKDIAALKTDELLGFLAPIKFSKSYNGYYYSDTDYEMHKINLNENEIDSIKTMLGVLNTFTGTSINENFNQAVHKIFVSLQEKFPEGNQKIVQAENSPVQLGFEYFDLFYNLAKNKTPVSLVQYSYKKRVFESYIFHAYMLKEFQNGWYVIGFSEKHKNIRTVALETIYEPILLGCPFKETDMEQLIEYFQDMYGVFPLKENKKQVIILHVSPDFSDYLNAHPIHKSQKKIKEFDHGSALFELDIIPSIELLEFFLANGKNVRVVEPIWLKKEIHEDKLKALKNEE